MANNNEKSERKEKEEQHQDMELVSWRKKIEIIGIDIKGLERESSYKVMFVIAK
jgi:hypothetical protein